MKRQCPSTIQTHNAENNSLKKALKKITHTFSKGSALALYKIIIQKKKLNKIKQNYTCSVKTQCPSTTQKSECRNLLLKKNTFFLKNNSAYIVQSQCPRATQKSQCRSKRLLTLICFSRISAKEGEHCTSAAEGTRG